MDGPGGGRGWRVLAAIAVAAAILLVAAGPAASKPPSRPNVVVIETDDQTQESLRVMPNVRGLIAAKGTEFAQSFVSYPYCCPSRATFLTGQYAHNHGVMANNPPEGSYYKLNHHNTLPVWLQRAGYYTAHIGKYLNHYGTRDPTEVPPGWSEWHGSVDPSTYGFYGYTLNEGGSLVEYGWDPGSYQTDVYAAKARELIRRRAADGQPFFLWTAFMAPHFGLPHDPDDPDPSLGIATPSPAPRHRDRFAREPLPKPPSYDEEDVSDKPAAIANRAPLTAEQEAAIRERYQQSLESLLAVDEAVAGILSALRQAGELDDTLVIFTSDNGYFHGEHRIPTEKLDLYEPSIRVPLAMRGPGVPEGKVSERLVANVDLAPTILDTAGARPGLLLDGESLLRTGSRRRPRAGRALLIETERYTAVRTRRFIYAEHSTGEQELYDLARDPHQLESRHADERYRAVREALSRRLARLRSCRGKSCRRAGGEVRGGPRPLSRARKARR